MTAPPVPRTLAEALDPTWLTQALAPVTGDTSVTAVETVEVIRTVATKVRFVVTCGDGRQEALCLKGFLDIDAEMARGGAVTVLEADFYAKLAPHLSIRCPACVATVVDRDAQFGIVVMRDLIAQGARFCSALEPFTSDQAAESLAQLARLHAGRALLEKMPWVKPRIADFVRNAHIPLPVLQDMLNGPRGEGLPSRIRDAKILREALALLATREASRPQLMIHGDSHAGNIYRTSEGPGLIDWQLLQRGSWGLDVAYHIAAVLPVDVAAREEYSLLMHYLDVARSFGVDVPGPGEAWTDYRTSVVYGYYLWAITRRVEPPIINLFVNRLGSAIARHDSYRMLGLQV